MSFSSSISLKGADLHHASGSVPKAKRISFISSTIKLDGFKTKKRGKVPSKLPAFLAAL